MESLTSILVLVGIAGISVLLIIFITKNLSTVAVPQTSSISLDEIEGINEIGLVTDEPLNTGNEIIQSLNIDFFSKGPKREDFVAVGYESGLFVISNSKRNWYPTQELAEKWKVKAKVSVNESEYNLEYN